MINKVASDNPKSWHKLVGFVSVDQYKFDNFAVCKPPRLKVNYMLEDVKPLVEARLREIFRLSSVYLRVIKWGPQ